jgi:hypothetical protein
MGVRDAFETRDYAAVLIQVWAEQGEAPLVGDALARVVGIVEHIGAHAAEIGRTVVYLPDGKGRMAPAEELFFNDANWLAPSLEGRDDVRLVHPDVDRLVAEALGARSLRQLLSADSSLSMTYIGCPSIVDVRSVAPDSAGDSSLLLELLETADVCGSTDIQFILDFRSHPGVSLLVPTLAQFQGPSLCVFLPEVVLARKELTELLSPRGASFRGRPCRFGSGLLSCFLLGDVVSVVAGESYYLFDPSGNFLLPDADSFGDASETGDRLEQKQSAAAVGKEYQYVASSLSSRFPDQFAPFSVFGFNGEQSLPGTVLRIPLRTAHQAKFSEISTKGYATLPEFSELALALESAARSTSLLLFARHLCSVRFQVLEEVHPITTRSHPQLTAVQDDPDGSGGPAAEPAAEVEAEPAAAQAQAAEPPAEPASEPAAAEGPGSRYLSRVNTEAAAEKAAAAAAAEAEGGGLACATFWELSMSSAKAVDRWTLMSADWKPSGIGGRFSKMFATWKPPKTRDFLAFRFKDNAAEHTDNWIVTSTLGSGLSRDLAGLSKPNICPKPNPKP